MVPSLLDKGARLASEASFYRVIKAHDQLNHRERNAQMDGDILTKRKLVFPLCQASAPANKWRIQLPSLLGCLVDAHVQNQYRLLQYLAACSKNLAIFLNSSNLAATVTSLNSIDCGSSCPSLG